MNLSYHREHVQAKSYLNRGTQRTDLWPSCFVHYFFEFTLDDSYITFRYSQHLATGEGIVWNTGNDPVEGYTSTMWMLLAAAVIGFGLPVVFTMKSIGILSGVITIGIVVWYGYHTDVDPKWTAVTGATIALSPAVAVLSVQEMETLLAVLFTTIAAIAAVELADEYRNISGISLGVALLFGMLTRPGLVIYAGGILMSLFVSYLLRGQRQNAVHLFFIGVVFLLIPGVVFVITRWIYFGYPLPNSFYIKSGSGLLYLIGGFNIGKFLTAMIGPILPVVGIMVVFDDSSIQHVVQRTLPVAIGVVGFLAVWLFVNPIQGFLWRFQVPALGPVLIVLIQYLREAPSLYNSKWSLAKKATAVIVVLSLIGFPIHTVDNARHETRQRTQADRVAVGQQLSELSGENYRMLTTESGAVPYYSEWTAVDVLGLNSERIAHSGLDRELLQDYNPDLVMMVVTMKRNPFTAKSSVVAEFLAANDYQLVFVTNKPTSAGKYHVYFVPGSGPDSRKISCALSRTENVKK